MTASELALETLGELCMRDERIYEAVTDALAGRDVTLPAYLNTLLRQALDAETDEDFANAVRAIANQKHNDRQFHDDDELDEAYNDDEEACWDGAAGAVTPVRTGFFWDDGLDDDGPWDKERLDDDDDDAGEYADEEEDDDALTSMDLWPPTPALCGPGAGPGAAPRAMVAAMAAILFRSLTPGSLVLYLLVLVLSWQAGSRVGDYLADAGPCCPSPRYAQAEPVHHHVPVRDDGQDQPERARSAASSVQQTAAMPAVLCPARDPSLVQEPEAQNAATSTAHDAAVHAAICPGPARIPCRSGTRGGRHRPVARRAILRAHLDLPKQPASRSKPRPRDRAPPIATLLRITT